MEPKAYLAGIGMVTPIGENFPMTAAAVRAGISQYMVSDYLAEDGQPVTMSLVPDELFGSISLEIDEGNYFSDQYERVIKMAVMALKEAVEPLKLKKPLPLILAFPEQKIEHGHTYPECLKTNLLAYEDLPLSRELMYSFYTGRAGGIEAVSMALRYLYDLGHEYVAIGGSDSYYQCPRLVELKDRQRLLTLTNSDGFAPGEGAAFVVLTRDKSKAITFGGKIVGIYESGTAQENGYIYGDSPYLGEALDVAVGQALRSSGLSTVDMIYSNMNGERYWAKELGVTMMRSLRGTGDGFRIEHPADCYGDIGTASAPVLMGLAMESLFKDKKANSSIVYSSSDGPGRAAVVLQKV
jgi:3-oxoacyl-[acyl-carrier-protein] synthase I